MSRKLWSMSGGVHLPDNKKLSSQAPISTVPFPEHLVIPVSQHIGAPAHPVVKVGDKVLGSQVIAIADGGFSIPVHASTSGKVTAIGPHPVPHPSNLSAPCITIEPDGEHREVEKTGYIDYRNTPKQILLDKIHDCGIAGMGGAGFPTRIKLDPRNPDSIHTLIVNAAECEPYITADDRLIREMTDEVVIGISVLAHLLGRPANCIIAVEDNKPEAIAALRTAATGKDIEVVVLPTKYPTGSEKQLIQIITGQQVPPGKLPSDLGVVVQNITTTVAVFRAVILGKPLSRRVTTVTGEAIARPGNYKVLLGTPLSHLLKHTGFDPSLASRLIMGGPMMGFTVADQRVPIVKTSNCILAPSIQELPPPPPAQPCINCGLCMQACPMQLLPQQLYWHSRGHNQSQLEKLKLMDCIECGSCSYTCTSNIPLVHYFRAAKGEIRAAQQAQLANQHAKQRQQARVDRKAAILAEKEAKRLARKKPGNPPVTADTPDSDQPTTLTKG